MKKKLTTALVIAALAALGGCKKDDKKKGGDDTKKPTAGKTTQKDPKPAPEPKKWTAADTMKRFDECWGYWNAGDKDKFLSCYADSATQTMVDNVPPMEMKGKEAIAKTFDMFRTAMPDHKGTAQLVLVNGNNFASIVLTEGTNSGEMMGMPATNKKVAMLGAQVGLLDDKGNVMVDRHLSDQSTMMAQLGVAPNPMSPTSEEAWADTVRATAESSETETKNVAVVKSVYENIQKKDTEAIAAVLADDAKFRWAPSAEVSEGKEAYIKGLEQYLAMHDTMEKKVVESWGAGDWVVNVVETKAKLAADIPGTKGTKGKEYSTTQFEFTHLADGKIKQHWVFDNSLAMMVQVGAVDPSKMMPAGKGGEGDKAPAKK